MYNDAITTYKYLIDNYKDYENIPHALYSLYSSYLYLDTGKLQSVRNTLYGNLKFYLDDKIALNDYKQGFVEIAYDILF